MHVFKYVCVCCHACILHTSIRCVCHCVYTNAFCQALSMESGLLGQLKVLELMDTNISTWGVQRLSKLVWCSTILSTLHENTYYTLVMK